MRNYFTVDSSVQHAEIALRSFHNKNYLYLKTQIKFTDAHMKDVLKLISDAVKLKPVNVEMQNSWQMIITYPGEILISLSFDDVPEGRPAFASASIIGPAAVAPKLREALKAKFFAKPNQQADWYFQDAKGSVQSTNVDLSYNQKVLDEFYPWVEAGLNKFFNGYIEDDANVLVLLGEPGTGKTSFVRELIFRQDLATMVTHDAGLMNKDELFIRFISGSNDLLVLEDADVMIGARLDGNKVMAKLLNAADGLIRTKKKIVITANLAHIEDIDAALIRPGRCFGVLKFRELTHSEATAAAKAAGLPDPKGAATLANLFKGVGPKIERRTGF